ncbi:hypothetical protein AAFF_G00075830 [Aldrovandia affinis]|uniref:Uncharacterized protein n=1 Tax=Aldrovandia affinis TaxID=143900 RepID=A0AAD7WD84_9TELE|nr:hypothetical protein AAFF_G00075830 [Aldrovandia affinis]
MLTLADPVSGSSQNSGVSVECRRSPRQRGDLSPPATAGGPPAHGPLYWTETRTGSGESEKSPKRSCLVTVVSGHSAWTPVWPCPRMPSAVGESARQGEAPVNDGLPGAIVVLRGKVRLWRTQPQWPGSGVGQAWVSRGSSVGQVLLEVALAG